MRATTDTAAFRVVVLISGTGTLFEAMLEQFKGHDRIRIAAVVADRPAIGLDIARRAGVPVAIVEPKDFPDRSVWNQALARTVGAFRPDLVVSAGFMRILGRPFLDQFGDRTINTHPALLPHFPGAHAVRDALAAGASVTGCTVHVVDAGTDTGPIIAQRSVTILPGDTEDGLHERIKRVERALLPQVIETIVEAGTDPAVLAPLLAETTTRPEAADARLATPVRPDHREEVEDE